MNLVLKLDLDIIKKYVHTENEAPDFSLSNIIAWTETHR